MADRRPLVVHVVYGFHTGGLENGIVNLVNHLRPECFRHTILALTTCSPDFCRRIQRDDVKFIEMNKSPGHAIGLYPALYRLFRRLRPDIVHTRNLAALETVVPARAAGVPVRIHGEHGWDVSDLEGKSFKARLLRRLYRPFVSQYVALSGHLADYLATGVRIPTGRISRICNGVDVARFRPSPEGRRPLAGSPFNDPRYRVVGTVGRLQAVKDQVGLVRAFARMVERSPAGQKDALRLMIAGDGPLRERIEAEVARCGLADRVWLAGERADVPDVMRAMDVFVLPSLAEGISNTILEAMASGLPVVATDVGGNPELLVPGDTGALVPASDGEALAEALSRYALDPALASAHGRAGRARAEAEFSIEQMVARYTDLYQSRLEATGWEATTVQPSV